jgi:hypothetical protein
MVGADTAWIIVATALVLFMTLPGLALFYGGLVRARNVLSVFMHVYAIAALMSVLWLVVGYSIAFGEGNAYWGGLGKAFLNGIDADTLFGTIPEVLFFAFQMTFAIITPALIVGAYVERIGFGFVLAFSALWMLLVYAPVTHWIWGGGFLSDGGIFGATNPQRLRRYSFRAGQSRGCRFRQAVHPSQAQAGCLRLQQHRRQGHRLRARQLVFQQAHPLWGSRMCPVQTPVRQTRSSRPVRGVSKALPLVFLS